MTLNSLHDWRQMLRNLEYGHASGDYEPFLTLLRKCALRWYESHYGMDREFAEDTVQVLLIRVWERCTHIALPTAEHYLRRAIANTAKQQLRNRNRQACVPWESLEREPAPRSWEEEIAFRVWVDTLDEVNRKIVHLLCAGYNLTEICDAVVLTRRELNERLDSIRDAYRRYRDGTPEERHDGEPEDARER